MAAKSCVCTGPKFKFSGPSNCQKTDKNGWENFWQIDTIDRKVTRINKKESIMAKVTIDDKEYDTDDMSEDANAQLVSLQFVSAEIQRLQALTAAMQTAANGYSVALGQALNAED